MLAGHQTAGRGQRGRTWFSSPRDLAVTFVIQPNRPVQQLPILTGLAVREALQTYLGTEAEQTRPVQVKWPNDVLLWGRKLAGVLCERKSGADLLGIGVNVDHRGIAVPLAPPQPHAALNEASAEPDRWEVLAAIAQTLRRRLLETPPLAAWAWAMRTWREHDWLFEREIEVSAQQERFVGVASGIDAHGRLLVSSERGVTAVDSGSVRAVRK